ncbi:MAG: hypothetical protein H0V17_22570 [Deltaproteobacteria bacterium]|nr:hypothetical protein [Deltaproteobacteria bacterium]
MIIPVDRLLRRLRQVPSRAGELRALRRRLRTARAAETSPEEQALALELRALKLEISHAFGAVSTCTRCVPHHNRGVPAEQRARLPFSGGECCGGVTEELFSDDELAALALAGTRARDLDAPITDHGGCAFRGLEGCTLTVANRPQRCVHYTCKLLREELRTRGDLAPIQGLLAQLQQRMNRFVEARHERLDDELFQSLETALVDARDQAGTPVTNR